MDFATPDGTTPYAWARNRVANGDLLLFNRRGLIALGLGSKASHAALAVWRNSLSGNTLGLVEAREWFGLRWVTLSSQVRQHPGAIDVYEPVGLEYEVKEYAAYIAANQSGKRYNYADLLRVALERLPFLHLLAALVRRLLRLAPPAPLAWNDDKFCSQGVAYWYLRAIAELRHPSRWRPVHNLDVRRVTPVDLERSGSFRLKFSGLTV